MIRVTNKVLGKKIKKARKKKNLTQEDIAELLHVTRQAVSNWELGVSKINNDILMELCELLEMRTPAKTKRIVLITSACVLAIVAFVAIILNNMSNFTLYDISSSNPYIEIENSTLILSSSKNRLSIGSIKLIFEEEEITNFRISIFKLVGNEQVTLIQSYYDSEIKLEESSDSSEYFGSDFTLYNLYLTLYFTYNGEEQSITTNLVFTHAFGSKSKVYKDDTEIDEIKYDNENFSITTESLLNNGYTEISDGIYEKAIENFNYVINSESECMTISYNKLTTLLTMLYYFKTNTIVISLYDKLNEKYMYCYSYNFNAKVEDCSIGSCEDVGEYVNLVVQEIENLT